MPISLDLEQQLAAWNHFIRSAQIIPTVDPLVARSWTRCQGRLLPERQLTPKGLSPDHLLSAQVAHFDLISVARPVMEDMYQFLENTGVTVTLVNYAGYVLDMLGDAEMLLDARQRGITAGVLLAEAQLGTNAYALALAERVPARTVGAEHYLRQFHDIASAAAPIFDLTGRLLGAVGVSTRAPDFHQALVSLVATGARAIESQRQADGLLAEQNRQLAALSAILDSASEGILVWNAEGALMHVNEAATRLLEISPQALLGRPGGDLFEYPAFIRQALDGRVPLKDVEATIGYGERSFRCFLSLRFVENHKKELQWVIVIIRPAQEVNDLVGRQLGAQALLTLDDVIGESYPIQQVRRLARLAAAARAPILLQGESGTGKNALARAIHNESPWSNGPFVVFACSSVPGELLLRELLGYDVLEGEKTPGGRPSKFELAQHGILFFQDVEYLPLEAQVTLLNVLELGVVLRQGSYRPVPVDVRIIASSTARLDRLAVQGSFRSDLLYRLGSIQIKLPPLRERTRDIPLLAERILSRISRQIERPLHPAPGSYDLLRRYPWPGNIRELEAALSQAAAQSGVDGRIEPTDLPEYIRAPAVFQGDGQVPVRIPSLLEVERDTLLQTAHLCGGNVTQMARVLGLGRTTVWRKLKEFDISIDSYRVPPEVELRS